MTIHDHRLAHDSIQVGVAQRVIATYEQYDEAVHRCRALAEAGVPEGRVGIAGRGLSVTDRNTGYLSTADVTARGAVSGLIVGGLTGWLLGLFDLVTSSIQGWWLIVNAAALGAVLGAAVALVGYAATRGRRSFSTPSPAVARYDVLVDADLADHAVRVLTEGGPGDRGPQS